MKTFEQATEHLSKGRNPDYRPLPGRSTSLERRGANAIAVRYHATDVVTYHRDGPTVLDSGGWRTFTTKERMCEYSPAIICQVNGIWYVGRSWANEPTCLYVDGLKVGANGSPIGGPSPDTTKRLEAAKRKVDRLVSAYIRGFCAHLRTVGHVEQPSPGDCFYCVMRTEDGKPLGDKMGGGDHLLSHFEEGYHVPALLVNAIKERGYGGGVGYIVASTNADLQRGEMGRYSLTHVKDSLRAYFRQRKLGLAEMLAH